MASVQRLGVEFFWRGFRVFFLGVAWTLSSVGNLAEATDGAEPQKNTPKHRLIIMADMGNEPDEEQQMMHLLIYANKIDIEGLIACSGKYLHADRTDGRTSVHPEKFVRLIDGYASVVSNLALHEPGWPTADYLYSIVKAGTAEYGIQAVAPGKSNEASKLIESAILKDDPRPLYIVCNAGANTLAQALVDLDQSRSTEQMNALCDKIIVFENGAQDNSGAWIAGKYPRIAWHRSNHQTYSYGGPGKATGPYTWQPYSRAPDGQNDWAMEHIMHGHGALGEAFPPRMMGKRLHFIEGGGTIPWMGLIHQTLSDPERLYWGGWSGRFSREKHNNILSRHQDIRRDEKSYDEFAMFEADSESEQWTDPETNETFVGRSVPVWRFRREMFREFQARIDWCIKPFEKANHNPVATIAGHDALGIIQITATAGDKITLDASPSSDPDGDSLSYRWWIYQEAGTYQGNASVRGSNNPSVTFAVPSDSAGTEIHLILEVSDDNPIVPLTSYRRVVISAAE
ncbi:MAG: DUF1593 domain-containing protein [Aureliella sp.]